MLGVIAGHDPLDSTSSNRPVPDYARSSTASVTRAAHRHSAEYFVEGWTRRSRRRCAPACASWRSSGAQIDAIALPHTEYAVATYYLVATAEASSNLARYDGMQYGRARPETENMLTMYQRTRAAGFGTEVKRRIMLGTYALSAGYYDAYYLKAQKVRTLIRRDFDEAFERCDVIVTPTAPTTGLPARREDRRPAADVSLRHLHHLGQSGRAARDCRCPAASPRGLPIGLQIVGRPFEEARVFQAAYAYEQATQWHKKTVPGP